MRHTAAGRALTKLVLETFRFNGRLLSAGDRLARPFVLTSARWQVLGAIEKQPLSVAQIARDMGLARQNVQRLADALCKEGIIHYAPNPRHLRAKLACLTGTGRRAVQEVGKRQIQWANRIAAAVNSKEIEEALRIMHKLRMRVESDRSKSK